jgi:hypothetical protein
MSFAPVDANPLTKKDACAPFLIFTKTMKQLENSYYSFVNGFRVEWHLHSTTQFNHLWERSLVFRLDDKLDGSPYLVFDGYICELRHATHIDAIVPEITGCQNQSLDRLIDGSSSDGLHFRSMMFTDHACDCASDGGGS